MRVIPQMFGMTDKQWREARAFYKKAFGEDAMLVARPAAIRDYWLEKEKAIKTKATKKKRKKSTPKVKKTFESIMEGVRY